MRRDIAARNVLVGSSKHDIKLADLGAARNVFRAEGGVYTATTEHNPARWMPLEALANAEFSHKSDVYAFGVLLWELISFGRTPWGAFGNADMIEALQRGERMDDPKLLPCEECDKLYATAIRCWRREPAKRPPFRQLSDELQVGCAGSPIVMSRQAIASS